MSYTNDYLTEVVRIANLIDAKQIDAALTELQKLRRRGGRLYILGNGGSAANASHAVNDFRKIARMNAYTPTDNVAELTALINDTSWSVSIVEWLKCENVDANDLVLVLSVGGGGVTTSSNLSNAMQWTYDNGVTLISIVGRTVGYATELSDVSIAVPIVNENRVTPHAEEWQSIILHLLVNALTEK